MNDKTNTKLKSELGLITTVLFVIGAVIGSGIFKKPALMAGQLGSPEILIGIWVVAGIITLFGALTNAEVAGMISETGGQYIFFQRIFGEFTAFLYGWAIFTVIQTGSIASISYVFGEYSQVFVNLPHLPEALEKSFVLHIPMIGNIFPLDNLGVKAVTIGLIGFLTFINFLGVKLGGRVVAFFTSTKVLIMLFFVFMALFMTSGSLANFTTSIPAGELTQKSIFLGIVAAMSGAFWAYDGWNNVTYLAGEIKRPQKNIPIALVAGTIVIILIYVLINIAYLYVLPMTEMAKSTLVAADAATKILGTIGGGFIAGAVMVSTFGTSNGTIMASARVYYAMSNRGMFFESIGKTHKRFFTPANALWLQFFWSALLVMSGTFDILTDMLIFVSWIFYMMGAIGVFVLRKKEPDTPRPYKVWGYPYVPIIFIVFAFFFVIFTIYNDIIGYIEGRYQIINSVFGLLLLSTGIPFYFIFKKIYETKD
jgi:APA family basic amino acid/polyamine antiporter